MARIPCSFSAQEDFLARIDARAADLGMKRSEYIVHALRMELSRGGAMLIDAGHRVKVKGDNNLTIGGDFTLPSNAHARKPAMQPKGQRGKGRK